MDSRTIHPDDRIIKRHTSKSQKIVRVPKLRTDIFKAEKLRPVYEKAKKFARHKIDILIMGETGTGKEYLAQFIHQHSSNPHTPFLAINCSNLSESLFESILFGHKKGTFTGAFEDKQGIFRSAGFGTVFLDEIGNTSIKNQQSLLRVLQEREIFPLGYGAPIRINCRVLAATNRNVGKMCDEGTFQKDLFQRFKTNITMPSLRLWKKKDREGLLRYLITKSKKIYDKKKLKFSDESIEFLVEHPLPGNIRELENKVNVMCILKDDYVELKDVFEEFPELLLDTTSNLESLTKLEQAEKQIIIEELIRYNFNKTRARKAVGIINANTFDDRIMKYELQELIDAGKAIYGK